MKNFKKKKKTKVSNSEVVGSSAMMERNTVYWLHAVNEVPGHRHIQCGEHSMGEVISSFCFFFDVWNKQRIVAKYQRK